MPSTSRQHPPPSVHSSLLHPSPPVSSVPLYSSAQSSAPTYTITSPQVTPSLLPPPSSQLYSTFPPPWGPLSTLPDYSVADHLPPLPGKLVSRIQCGQFVDFAELLPASFTRDLGFTDPALTPSSAVRPPPRPRIRSFEDWLLGWASFASVTLSTQPQRAHDLIAYMTTILQAYCDYGGDRWLAYDRAFRRNAATRPSTNWANRDLNLWSYAFTRPSSVFCEFCETEHSSGAACIASTRPSAPQPLRRREPSGNPEATEWCRSWNRGKCTSPRDHCIYRHACWHCYGSHRAANCNTTSSFQQNPPKRPRQSDRDEFPRS